MAMVVHRNCAATARFSKPRAYVPFLAGNGDYVKGAVGLAKGLRKAGSAYPLVVAVLPDVPESHCRLLVSQGCIVREIEPVHSPEDGTDKLASLGLTTPSTTPSSGFGSSLNTPRWCIWMLIYKSTTTLTNSSTLRMAASTLSWTAAARKHGRTSRSSRSATVRSKQPSWGSRCQRWERSQHSTSTLACLCMAISERFLAALKMTPKTPFAEQDFLNMYFRDVYKPIPQVYNFVIALLWRHPENIEVDKVKVVHFCPEGSKPWRYTGKEVNMDREDVKMLVKKWRDIYNDDSLDYEYLTTAVPIGGVQKAGLRVALSETGVRRQCQLVRFKKRG